MGDRTRLISALMLGLIAISLADGTELSRQVPASNVRDLIEAGQPAEFDNCIIVGDLNLNALKIEVPVHFNHTLFLNSVNFNSTTFNGTAYFRLSEFNYVDFGYSDFKSDADFGGSAFNGTAEFGYSEFNGTADFRYSAFNDDVDFSEATFRRDANFIGVTFKRYADFGHSAFKGDADFDASVFKIIANFGYSDFNGITYFVGSAFNYARFAGSAFNGYTDFGYSTFNGDADFVDTRFNITNFGAIQFNKEAQFDDAQFAGIASFNSSRFTEDALFENTIFQSKLSLTKARYDKLFIRWYNIKGGLIYDDAAYMSLLKNFKDLGYFEDFDSCYYQYREEHRGQRWNISGEPFLKLIDFLSEWSYGYGVRPMNPLLSSIILIISFGLFWRSKGIGRMVEFKDEYDSADDSLHNRGHAALKWIEPQTILDVLSPFTFSFILFISAGKFLVDPPELPEPMKEPNTWTKRMFDIEKILGGVFLALFFIALSSTMIRAL